MSADGYPEARRQPLSGMQRYFQFYLMALFGNGVYVFSVIYAFLPSYLLESGYSTTDLSHAFGSDGITHSVGLLLLLYINGLPRVNAMSLRNKFWLIVASSVITLTGSIMLTAVPSSYPLLVGSKALQGLAAAVYFSYAYTLINKLFPLEYQAQAAAFVTAGLTAGDSVALAIGGVIYDQLGITAAYASQLFPNVLLLLMAAPLLMWDMQPCDDQEPPPALPSSDSRQTSVVMIEPAGQAAADDDSSSSSSSSSSAACNQNGREQEAHPQPGSATAADGTIPIPGSGGGPTTKRRASSLLMEAARAIDSHPISHHSSFCVPLQEEEEGEEEEAAGRPAPHQSSGRHSAGSFHSCRSGAASEDQAGRDGHCEGEAGAEAEAQQAGAHDGKADELQQGPQQGEEGVQQQANAAPAAAHHSTGQQRPWADSTSPGEDSQNGTEGRLPQSTCPRSAALLYSSDPDSCLMGHTHGGDEASVVSSRVPSSTDVHLQAVYAQIGIITDITDDAGPEPEPETPPVAALCLVLRNRDVLAECLLVFVCQISRTGMDILMPLLLLDLPTTIVSIVFVVEAAGSVAFPFLVDVAVQEYGFNSRKTCIGLMLVMAVSCATALLSGYYPLCSSSPGLCPRVEGGSILDNVPWGTAVVMAVFGASQSAAETLIFGHLAEHLMSGEDAAAMLSGDVAMNVFALFLVTGATVGSYVAGAPAMGVFWQQQLVACLMALATAAATLAVNLPPLLKKKELATSQPTDLWHLGLACNSPRSSLGARRAPRVSGTSLPRSSMASAAARHSVITACPTNVRKTSAASVPRSSAASVPRSSVGQPANHSDSDDAQV